MRSLARSIVVVLAFCGVLGSSGGAGAAALVAAKASDRVLLTVPSQPVACTFATFTGVGLDLRVSAAAPRCRSRFPRRRCWSWIT